MTMKQSTLTTAIEEATEILLKFSIPLYCKDPAGRPLQYGTAFFVRTQSKTFLVSAAHVLDRAKTHGLFYYSEPGQLRALSGQLIRSKGEEDRASDLIDVAVLRLPGDSVPPYPKVDKFAMDMSYLRPCHRPRTGKSYIFIGFPATKSTVNADRREVTVTAYAFRNDPIEESEYQSHGLDPNSHVALRLDVRKGFGADGTKQHFPKPNGMSGSPIVVLFDEGGDKSRVFPVVGVATTYRKADRLVFGTDISYVIDAIQNAA